MPAEGVPTECTALMRAYRRTGRRLPLDMLKNIGSRATHHFRYYFCQEPPKVWEYHPDAPRSDAPSGWLAVSYYPGQALALLDEAIDTFLRLEATPIPPLPGGQR
jgi:hypothetical protein